MTGSLTTGSVLLLGLVASGHCVVMCGGISGALGVVTAKDSKGRPRRRLLVAYQFGRIASYALAGLIVGSIGDGVLSLLELDVVRTALRVSTGVVLAMTAWPMLGYAQPPGLGFGRWVWPHIAQWGRRLIPVTGTLRAFGFGMLWGWMPCGIVYSVLLIAALSAHPLQAAAIMTAFGFGTLPAMLAVGYSAHRLVAWTSRRNVRLGIGCGLLVCALAISVAPWLLFYFPALHAWMPADCIAALR